MSSSSSEASVAPISFTALVTEAGALVNEACSMLASIAFDPPGPSSDEVGPEWVEYVAFITCQYGTAGWHLGVAADAETSLRIARAMFGIDAPSDDEIGDAMGEVVNVAAGMLKTHLHDRGHDIRIGLPLVQRGAQSCRAMGLGVHRIAAPLDGEGLRAQSIIVWKQSTTIHPRA